MTTLEQIQEYAELFFSPSETALLIEKDAELLLAKINDETTAEYAAYMKGVLTSEAKIRREMVEMAQAGSPKAQEEMLKIISKLKTSLV